MCVLGHQPSAYATPLLDAHRLDVRIEAYEQGALLFGVEIFCVAECLPTLDISVDVAVPRRSLDAVPASDRIPVLARGTTSARDPLPQQHFDLAQSPQPVDSHGRGRRILKARALVIP